jgi:hypothetical protein
MQRDALVPMEIPPPTPDHLALLDLVSLGCRRRAATAVVFGAQRMGVKASRRTLTQLDRRTRVRVAHHEAGHFVAAIAGDLPAYGITIVPHGDTLGQSDGEEVTWWVGQPKPSARIVRRQVISLFAGYAATRRSDPSFADESALAEAADDFRKAREIMWLTGKSERQLLKAAHQLVERRWSQIQLVARGLLKKHRLNGEEAEFLLALAEGDARAGADLVHVLGWTPKELRTVTGIVVVQARSPRARRSSIFATRSSGPRLSAK